MSSSRRQAPMALGVAARVGQLERLGAYGVADEPPGGLADQDLAGPACVLERWRPCRAHRP